MQFSLLEFDSYNLLKKFIKKNFKQNHIYVKNKNIFDWQHKNNKSYTCLVCFTRKTLLRFKLYSIIKFDLPSNQLF